jgi:hypothetical protein
MGQHRDHDQPASTAGKGVGMATRVVVTLQDDVYRRVERLAQLPNRDVADLLADTPLDVSAGSRPHVASLTDEEVRLSRSDLASTYQYQHIRVRSCQHRGTYQGQIMQAFDSVVDYALWLVP